MVHFPPQSYAKKSLWKAIDSAAFRLAQERFLHTPLFKNAVGLPARLKIVQS